MFAFESLLFKKQYFTFDIVEKKTFWVQQYATLTNTPTYFLFIVITRHRRAGGLICML